MILAEFLTQPDIVALTDEDALAAAIAYEEVKVWRIEGQVRKTQVETTVIMNDTIERLEKMVQNIEMLESPNGTQAAQRKLARAILHALAKLYMEEFYINLNDAEVKAMFDNALALGVLLQAEYDEILDAATHRNRPFESTGLFDVLAFRDKLVKKPLALKDGYAVINVLSDTPSHNPRVTVTNPRTGKEQRITSFYGVSKAGKYECLIPRDWRRVPLFVDDIYGLIE